MHRPVLSHRSAVAERSGPKASSTSPSHVGSESLRKALSYLRLSLCISLCFHPAPETSGSVGLRFESCAWAVYTIQTGCLTDDEIGDCHRTGPTARAASWEPLRHFATPSRRRALGTRFFRSLFPRAPLVASCSTPPTRSISPTSLRPQKQPRLAPDGRPTVRPARVASCADHRYSSKVLPFAVVQAMPTDEMLRCAWCSVCSRR